jgi:hypothetical protein
MYTQSLAGSTVFPSFFPTESRLWSIEIWRVHSFYCQSLNVYKSDQFGGGLQEGAHPA